MNIHIIPHTHDDLGVETIKTLIQNGQLEIIGGGWVQPDEAATHYIDLVDQYTLGLRLLNNSFGSCARPKTAWQIDPFGHSREHANLMAMMGYDSLWFAREHYLEHEMRRSNRALQMMWHVSDDNQTTILTGAFYAHYNMPGGFNFDIMGNDDPIQDNPNLENYNLDEKLSTFVNDLITYNKSMLHNHIMILMGDDFTYQDANMWFTNLDKLIKHLNQNYSNILTASYSTPTCYAQAIKSISTIQWPQKYTDFFPYASGTDSLWTGYFTSKPTMKGLVRKSSALLQLIRQLQSLALTSWDVQQGAQVEALERAIALSQHHDGITGTSKQFVTQDYMMRMLQGWTSGEQVLNSAMQTISQRVKKNVVQFPQQIICRNVNESECAFTKNNNVYTVTVHNGNSQTLNALVKVPLYQATKNVAVTDYQGNPINVEISTVFTNYAGLQQALPSNIHLLTLKQVDSSNILLRLEHIYQSMEDPTLSQPVSINLASLFSYDIVQIQELSLAANNVSSVLAGTTITLNHMDIKTYLLNVNVGNQGCTCSGSWYQSSINPCDCYNFVQTPTDWTSANNDCRKQNPRASLSSVDSAFENNELLSLLQSKTSCSQAFIGMTQQTSNVWSWINNDTSPYRNWRTGYPSGNNQCSQLNTNDGKWTNIDCTTQGCYVCEIKN
uniref:alpha-mannosidase n=1 Tax=Acrobeloides nanus TaxID=290746 RepID=A0A914C2F7_9BILA